MGDMRFIMIGVVLIFVGFIILGGFGNDYQAATLESNEFGTCYDYSDNKEPTQINCSDKILNQTVFFSLVIGIIGGGIIALIKGMKGNWDNEVKPEDMVGPKRDNSDKD